MAASVRWERLDGVISSRCVPCSCRVCVCVCACVDPVCGASELNRAVRCPLSGPLSPRRPMYGTRSVEDGSGSEPCAAMRGLHVDNVRADRQYTMRCRATDELSVRGCRCAEACLRHVASEGRRNHCCHCVSDTEPYCAAPTLSTNRTAAHQHDHVPIQQVKAA